MFPAAVLLVAGLQQLTDEPHGWGLLLAILEVVVGLLMLGAIARTVRGSRHLLMPRTAPAHAAHAAHPAIEWENLIAAAMVLAEGWEHRLHGGRHFSRPAMLMAAVLIVTGFLNRRIIRRAQARRTLRVTDTELYVPGRPFKARAIRASWAQLASIQISDRRALIATRAGRTRTLDLSDLEDADRIREALTEAERRRVEYG